MPSEPVVHTWNSAEKAILCPLRRDHILEIVKSPSNQIDNAIWLVSKNELGSLLDKESKSLGWLGIGPDESTSFQTVVNI